MRLALPRIRRPKLLDRLARNRRGAAAVEFALVSIPFLALIFGVVEIGMIFFISTTLESATNATARLIRTGQMQASGTATSATFVSGVCNQLSWLGSSCTSNLFVDVRTFSSFSSMSAPSPIVNGQIQQANLLFNIGAAGDIVLVRTFYQWTVFTPLLDGIGTPVSGGHTLLTSAAAFRNEPY
jgi:Flp pilus assembly protein TadG